MRSFHCPVARQARRRTASTKHRCVPRWQRSPILVRFGSWIGGDRDGNPFVTADTTADALAMARALLHEHYLLELRELFEQLASSTHQAAISAELQARLDGYIADLRAAGGRPSGEFLTRFPNEAIRLALACITLRLGGEPPSTMHRNLELGRGATLSPYPGADAFLEDLVLVRDSLARNRGERLAELFLDPLLLEVRTFGLHLQTLDIRQHARVHAAALDELTAWQPDAAAPGSAPQLQLPPSLSAQTAEVLATFRAIADFKRSAPATIAQYVISGASSAEDSLRVLWLARLGNVKVEGLGRGGAWRYDARSRCGPAACAAVRVHRGSAERAAYLPRALVERDVSARCLTPGIA